MDVLGSRSDNVLAVMTFELTWHV